MTAAFAPASQTTFQPRTVREVEPQRRALVAVPEPQAPVEVLATVHELPVVHLDEVYRRRRLVALAVVVALVLGLVSSLGAGGGAPAATVAEGESVTVVVQPGDTLWAIAAELAPSDDPRVLVAQLTELAGSSALQPGQELVVPGAWLG